MTAPIFDDNKMNRLLNKAEHAAVEEAEAFNEANKQHAIAYGAIVIALIDKGVITQEEYDRAFAQATVIIDQEFARKRDEAKGTPL